jgi:cytochrome c
MLRTPYVAIAALALAAGAAAASGDPAEGEKVFRKCMACHQVGEGAKNRVGPVLNGVIGREIASVEGFRYSDAFVEKRAEGFVWTEEALHAYLERPREFIAKNKMSFAGLRKAEDRDDVIAYLASFQ